MPTRRQRSRSHKRHQVRTPGGLTRQHYKRKKVRAARCTSCGRPLGGVPKINIRKLPRSSRMPNRPFGGYFCSACARNVIKETARA